MSAELASVAYCGASFDHHSCALEEGHTGMHGAPIPGDLRSSWTWWRVELLEPETAADPLAPIYATPPWTKHRFPPEAGRIAWKAMRASRRYRCRRGHELPAGHAEWIEPGEHYVRVSTRPKGPRGGFKSHELCRGCSIDYRLATTAAPPAKKEKGAS